MNAARASPASQAYPGIEVVARQPADFDRTKGLDVMTNRLQAHPDIQGVFAENDEMALGAVKALGSKAGTSVSVIGFDGEPDGLKAVKNGTMYASVAQQPKESAGSRGERAERRRGQDGREDGDGAGEGGHEGECGRLRRYYLSGPPGQRDADDLRAPPGGSPRCFDSPS